MVIDGQVSIPRASYLSINSVDASDVTFHTVNVPGNGDCFFNCLSLCLHGGMSQATFYRRVICMSIYRTWNDWGGIIQACHDLTVQTKNDYFHWMVLTKEYATACEVKAASLFLKSNISVWLNGHRLDKDLGRRVDN